MPEEETIIVNPVEEGKDTLFPSLDIAKFEKQMKAYNSYSALNKFRNETGLSPSFDLNTLETLTAGNLLDLQNYSVSKFSVDFAGRTTVATPTAATHAATKAYADTKSTLAEVKADTDVASAISLKHTQGTDTSLGTQSANLNMGDHLINNVLDPSDPQDAATKDYVDDEILAINTGTSMGCTASETLKWSADTEVQSNDVGYTKYKEIRIRLTGTITVRFDLKSQVDGDLVAGRVYVNGVAVGQEELSAPDTYVTKTLASASVNTNDLVQLYLHQNVGTGADAFARNFRIYYTTAQAITEGEVITD